MKKFIILITSLQPIRSAFLPQISFFRFKLSSRLAWDCNSLKCKVSVIPPLEISNWILVRSALQLAILTSKFLKTFQFQLLDTSLSVLSFGWSNCEGGREGKIPFQWDEITFWRVGWSSHIDWKRNRENRVPPCEQPTTTWWCSDRCLGSTCKLIYPRKRKKSMEPNALSIWLSIVLLPLLQLFHV